MPQLSEIVKLEEPISFFKRTDITNSFGRLVETFEEYKIKGYLEKKIVGYNATTGEIVRPGNQTATEIEFLVLNYRIPTIAKKVSDGRVNKNLEIELGDQVVYKGEKFQIYNIIDVDNHAYRSCELVVYSYPVILDEVDEEIQKFWYLYLKEIGLDSFRDFPHWQVSHFYELMENDFATYEIIYVSNRDDKSVLSSTNEGLGSRLDYKFRFRRFIDINIKIYSNTKINELDFKLRNQKVMYMLAKYKPTEFYDWGIIEDKTHNMGARYVIINGQNKLQTSYKVRFGYTSDIVLNGDYIDNLNLKSHMLGGHW